MIYSHKHCLLIEISSQSIRRIHYGAPRVLSLGGFKPDDQIALIVILAPSPGLAWRLGMPFVRTVWNISPSSETGYLRNH